MPPTQSQAANPAISSKRQMRREAEEKRAKRHRKILRDNINGITKSSIRRLARRGGVHRVSATIYTEVKITILLRLREILRQCAIVIENAPVEDDKGARSYQGRKVVTVRLVIFVLKRMGIPIAGFGEVNAPDNRLWKYIREADE